MNDRIKRQADASKRPPPGQTSYLPDETRKMNRRQRMIEQEGHRHWTRLHAREHAEDQVAAPEGELQNTMRQHPWLDNQRFDGIDPNVNPVPPLNTEARRKFDDARAEQELQKQLRLERQLNLSHNPRFSPAPRPGRV